MSLEFFIQFRSSTPLPLILDQNTINLEEKFSTNDHHDKYSLKLKKYEKIFIIIESSQIDYSISIFDEEQSGLLPLKEFSTSTGNLIGKLEKIRKNLTLSFQINKMDKNISYQLYIFSEEIPALNINKQYITYVDDIKTLDCYFKFKNDQLYEKARFQVQVLNAKKKFTLNGILRDHQQTQFVLNEIFQKTIGEYIDNKEFQICQQNDCEYKLSISLEKVSTLIIESQFSQALEQLNYLHVGPYYERKYDQQQMTIYYLPWNDSVEDLDISFTLVPVVGVTGIYINADYLPEHLNKYSWFDTGKLAKRITIRQEELENMKIQKPNFYITIISESAGEYLVSIIAHMQGMRGMLSHGVIEAGFVLDGEILNYLYVEKIFEDQSLEFELTMNIVTGKASLFVQQCIELDKCNFNIDNINQPQVDFLKNEHDKKTINKKIDCKLNKNEKISYCYIMIGILGEENHGTHFDLVIHEKEEHRLITAGHNIQIQMNPNEKQFFKFTVSPKTSDSILYLNIDALQGNFTLYIDKKVQYPQEGKAFFEQNFFSTMSGLYGAYKILNLSEIFKNEKNNNVYYIGINSLTSCSLNMKFYEDKSNEILLNTLTAGQQQRGSIINNKKMVYYSIKASLETEQSSSISINLTPLKGKFQIYISRNGQIPTKENYDLTSIDNVLEFTYDEYINKDEYIIGIASIAEGDNQNLQFFIDFNYSNKPVKLLAGILSNFFIKTLNYFIIDINEEIDNLLILLAYRDKDVSMCGFFNGVETFQGIKDQCLFNNSNSISIFFDSQSIQQNCINYQKLKKCYFILIINGPRDSKFTIGYTYNEKPFKLIQNTVINGPNILKKNYSLNFIQHVDLSEPILIRFNQKGLDLQIYSILKNENEILENKSIQFPSDLNQDLQNKEQHGEIHSIFYPQDQLKKLEGNIELLISIVSTKTSESEQTFDGKVSFTLHSGYSSHSLNKNEILTSQFIQNEYKYFNFYNHGQNASFSIIVFGDASTQITLYLAKGINARPPYEHNFIKHQTGVQQVILKLQENDFKGETENILNSMKGHFTIGINSNESCNISIFWNNDVKDDIYELTPGLPQTLYNQQYRDLYFKLFVQEKQNQENPIIKFYINSSIKCNVYIHSTNNDEISYENLNEKYQWKSTFGIEGGIQVIQINPHFTHYCVNCTYYGYVESEQQGKVEVLISLQYTDTPVIVKSGIAYPEVLKDNQSQIYQYYNEDTTQFSFSITLISGNINIYIGVDQGVNQVSNQKVIQIGNEKRYKYFIVRPSDFKVSKPSYFYFKIESDKKSKAIFNMSVIKNSLKLPLEIGITKIVSLGELESAEYYFTNSNQDQIYNIDLELLEILDLEQTKVVEETLKDTLSVYLIGTQKNKQKLQTQILSTFNNRVYMQVKVSGQSQIGTYTVQVYNPVSTEIHYKITLTKDSFKLINMNEIVVEKINPNSSRIFEIVGNEDENLFVQIRICKGENQVSFIEGDHDKISQNDFMDHKLIQQNQSSVYYVKQNHERIFIQLQSQQDQIGIFSINIFNDNHIDSNPYSTISSGNQGRVKVDTLNEQLHFQPIYVSSNFEESFKHLVTYSVYLSENKDVVKYLKYCQEYFYDFVYPDIEFKKFSTSFIYNSISEINQKIYEKITIKIPGLSNKKKYFGTVIGTIELFSPNQSEIKSIKQEMIYYDDFILLTSKYQFSSVYLINILIILSLLLILYFFINYYTFGQVGNVHKFRTLKDVEKFDSNIYGFNSIELLEEQYYDTQQPQYEIRVQQPVNRIRKESIPEQFELSENRVPLEMDL